MKRINLNNDTDPVYDNNAGTVGRIHNDDDSDVKTDPTLMNKLTLTLLMAICAVIITLCIRYMSYRNKMDTYAIPEDAYALSIDEAGYSPEISDENIEYINQVTYNPSEAAARELGDAINIDKWGITFTCPYTWSFKSGYDYDYVKIPCVWVCTNDETGEVIAVKTATYDCINDEFEEIHIYYTKIGGKYIAAD